MNYNYPFLITTDSGCDLSYQVCEENGIIPLYMEYTDGNNFFQDHMVNQETIAFYKKMMEGVVFKTTQVNFNQGYEFFKELVKHNLPIVHLALGSGISGTYDNMKKAADAVMEEVPGSKITVIDTTLASMGYGMLCLEASALRDAGQTYDQIVYYLEDVKNCVNPYFTTNTLTYLARGGRVTKVAKIFGNVLSIRPILRLDNAGKLLVHTKGHGKKNTMDKMISEIKLQAVNPEEQVIYIAHSFDMEEAVEYGERLMKEVGFKDVYYSYIGSIIGAHTGPGLVACFFHGKERFA